MTDLHERAATVPSTSQRAASRGFVVAGAHRVIAGVVRVVRSPVLMAAVLVIAAGTGLRAWAVQQTWFWLDDISLVDIAQRKGLTLDALLDPYIGHLMPGGHALAWIISRSSPFDYRIAIIEMLTLYVIVCLTVLRLLVTLFGVRRGILVPFTFFVFSPWLVPAMSWWSVGITHLPALAATALTLDAHVRYLRSGRRRDLRLSLLWVFVGLLFIELTMLLYIPLTVITLAYFATGSLPQRVTSVWRDYRRAVVLHAALVVGYAAIYVQGQPSGMTSAEQVDVREYLSNLVMVVVPSAVVGGPGEWHQQWSAQFSATPTVLTRLVATAIIAGIFALTALTRERGLRAWVTPLLQLAAVLVLVVNSRSFFGPGFTLDLRYTTPLALGMALGLGMAFLPILGARESSAPRTRSWIVDRWPVPTLAMAAYVAFSCVTAANFPLLHVPTDKSPQTFYRTFETSLAAHEAPVAMLETVVPPRVLAGPEAFYPSSLAFWSDDLTYPEIVQDDYYVLDENGNLVHPSLKVQRRAEPATDAEQSSSCDGHVLSSRDRNVLLDGPVFGFVWRARLTYDADVETPVTIRHGDDTTQATFLKGRHVMELPAGGEYDRVGFSGLSGDAEVCLSELEVGTTTIPGLHPMD